MQSASSSRSPRNTPRLYFYYYVFQFSGLLHTSNSIQHHATTPDYRPTSVAIFVAELDLMRIYRSALVIAVCGVLSSLVTSNKKKKDNLFVHTFCIASIERSDCLSSLKDLAQRLVGRYLDHVCTCCLSAISVCRKWEDAWMMVQYSSR